MGKKLRFEMWADKDRGYHVLFETTTGRVGRTWFKSPPSDIDHVGLGYLKDRLWNVTRESQEKFIKKRFKEEAKKLGIQD